MEEFVAIFLVLYSDTYLLFSWVADRDIMDKIYAEAMAYLRFCIYICAGG